jgi:hypothetical protein
MEVQGQFNTGCYGEVMAATATAGTVSWFVCSGKGFRACDALIWTLCHKDVRIVGFWRKV